MIAARFALVALICLVRQIYWVTEQPSSSVAMFLPYLELVLYPARIMLGFPAGLFQRLHLGLAKWCHMCGQSYDDNPCSSHFVSDHVPFAT